MGFFLSIVIPACNEENRLPSSLGQVFRFLEWQSYESEVLVVENGSTDRTLQVAQEFADKYPNLRVFHEDQCGKGRAVRRGMLEAKGDFRFLCDADLSMPIEQVNRFLPPVCDCDIAIASREAPGAVRYGEPYFRHLTGRVFNWLIRLLLLPGLDDTQCGFKSFRAPIAEDVFRRQTLLGWSFDVEILYIAKSRGYRLAEIPIPWYYNPDSKVSVVRDSWRMLLDLWTIRINAYQGVYAKKD